MSHLRRRLAAALLTVSAITGLLLASAPAGAASAASAAPGSVVATDRGQVQGLVSASNRTFLGIPYAAPPIGDLRWKPPVPASPWAGVRQATTPGDKCAQVEELAGGTLEGSEDCLNLNVYEPATPGPAPLPVVVFIPGGGYVFGSNTDVDPSVLAQSQHLIVVTLNYRLGALGYLATPQLNAQDPAASGNFGLLDQQAALRWVRTNIAAFGGDPARTTLAGESAGGAAVLANVISPSASGLFQRAIIESGAGVGFTTRSAAQAQGAALTRNVGCASAADQLACLRGTDVTTLLKNELLAAPPLLMPADMAWSPTVGAADLPSPPAAALASGAYNKVAVLQGTNHDEWRLFEGGSLLQGRPPLTDASYTGLMHQLFGAEGTQVLAAYPATAYDSPTAAYTAVATDAGFVCPARTDDQALAAAVPTYTYEFDDPNAPAPFTVPGFPLGAYHTAELLYVFPKAGYPRFSADQVALSKQIMGYWGAFAAHGTPNGAGDPPWTPYVKASDRFLELTPTGTGMAGTFTADHHCAFWGSPGI